MRTRFERAPGASFVAIGLQTGLAWGIEIDNPSGSWLYIPSLETFVPPYTIGWSMSFPYGVSSIDLVAQNGPAGQISTSEGSNVVVFLTDEKDAVSPSPGSHDPNAPAGSPDYGAAFIDQSVEPQVAVVQATQCAESVATTIFPVVGVAGKRIRIYEIDIAYGLDTGTDKPMDGAVKAFPNGSPTLGDFFCVGIVNPDHPVDRIMFDPPHNLAVGDSLQIDFYASWTDVFIDTTVRYRYV